jgi:hypothetical protein
VRTLPWSSCQKSSALRLNSLTRIAQAKAEASPRIWAVTPGFRRPTSWGDSNCTMSKIDSLLTWFLSRQVTSPNPYQRRSSWMRVGKYQEPRISRLSLKRRRSRRSKGFRVRSRSAEITDRLRRRARRIFRPIPGNPLKASRVLNKLLNSRFPRR